MIGGLIQQDNFGVLGKHSGQKDSLQLSAGQCSNGLIPQLPEAGLFQAGTYNVLVAGCGSTEQARRAVSVSAHLYGLVYSVRKIQIG